MKNDNPKISVIMPSYNEINYIEECIESVVNQTLTDIEIICVDGESDDGTLDVLKKYAQKDSRIQVFTSDKKSYGNQVNIGFSKSSGKYISIIETDDFIEKDMLETLYDLSENGTVDIIKSSFYHYDDSDKENPKISMDNDKENLPTNISFTLKEEPNFVFGHPSIWAGIYRREFLEENNIKMIEEKGGGWVDNPFFYETAILAKSIRYIHKAFYYYRESNPDSSSNTFDDFSLPIKRVNDMYDIFDKYGYVCEEVKFLFYFRLFRYIEIILENNDFNFLNLDKEICFAIHDVLEKVDEDLVKYRMPNGFKKLYYKLISPLFLMRFEENTNYEVV